MTQSKRLPEQAARQKPNNSRMEYIDIGDDRYIVAKPSLKLLKNFDRALLKEDMAFDDVAKHPMLGAEIALYENLKVLNPDINRDAIAEAIDTPEAFKLAMDLTKEMITWMVSAEDMAKAEESVTKE